MSGVNPGSLWRVGANYVIITLECYSEKDKRSCAVRADAQLFA